MDKDYHAKVISNVLAKLEDLDIDLYIILTSEGSDPATAFIPGVDTVGSGAFLFQRGGRKIGVASAIDAQDIAESGLFDEVVRYKDYDAEVADLVLGMAPRRVAMNFSRDVPFCDGLTMGRLSRFVESLGGKLPFETVSSDLFVSRVKEALSPVQPTP
ncbi:MAG: hypothetical protein LBS62_02190 [Clostridiales bacterium]|jgi:hypothetical protein|nr:hypothetical protein [Clostridiales bacterium]